MGEQREALGDWYDIMDLVEGQPWVETRESYRVSRNYFAQNSNARFADSILRGLSFLSDAAISGPEVIGTLVQREQAAGRHLLLAQESQDLNNVDCVRRGLTSQEASGIDGAHDSDEDGDEDRYDPRIELLDTDEVDQWYDPEGSFNVASTSRESHNSHELESEDGSYSGEEDDVRRRHLPVSYW